MKSKIHEFKNQNFKSMSKKLIFSMAIAGIRSEERRVGKECRP